MISKTRLCLYRTYRKRSSRFSDVSLRDFSDAEYEKSHKVRGSSKLTREAFQINV